MNARNQALVESIQAALGDKVVSLAVAHGEIALVVKAGDLLETMRTLRDRAELRFEQLMDLCGVDYAAFGAPASSDEGFPAGDANVHASGAAPSSAGVASVSGVTSPGAPVPPSDGTRFAVVYHLLSLANNWRLRVRTFAAADDFPVVDSVVGLWPSANWFEREAFDLYGVVFDGHPDLRRILTDYGFIGHPFRKDFPISGNVEMRYDPDQQRVIYQPVTIEPREITPRIVREENYADSEGFRKG
jgi:NADH-quinone oxidoreductase subunit C